jgi:hypothetical protein
VLRASSVSGCDCSDSEEGSNSGGSGSDGGSSSGGGTDGDGSGGRGGGSGSGEGGSAGASDTSKGDNGGTTTSAPPSAPVALPDTAVNEARRSSCGGADSAHISGADPTTKKEALAPADPAGSALTGGDVCVSAGGADGDTSDAGRGSLRLAGGSTVSVCPDDGDASGAVSTVSSRRGSSDSNRSGDRDCSDSEEGSNIDGDGNGAAPATTNWAPAPADPAAPATTAAMTMAASTTSAPPSAPVALPDTAGNEAKRSSCGATDIARTTGAAPATTKEALAPADPAPPATSAAMEMAASTTSAPPTAPVV